MGDNSLLSTFNIIWTLNQKGNHNKNATQKKIFQKKNNIKLKNYNSIKNRSLLHLKQSNTCSWRKFSSRRDPHIRGTCFRGGQHKLKCTGREKMKQKQRQTDGWMNILKTIGCLELKEDYYNCFII